ncbi:unnamed protein product [Sphenostylis stenocarpa]|uniref:ZF-HD dimerization-type domain-containing protein n=1 Tax=Sphenostylis stenocarpa TaxID=92480 RepID=A0AA86SY27_9FABA|nr:unnamed protein product [Sphenostylis stenocarpa]
MNTSSYTKQLEAYCEEEFAYEECCRNHAVNVGGSCIDGCHQYMKARSKRNSQKSFLCACCGCHRNFHRKKNNDSKPVAQTVTEDNHALDMVPVTDLGPPNNPEPVQQIRPPRRRRTTFSRDQKIQMTRFADILGWKPHKGNREDIQRFCNDMGINRKIFVIWLNNNRHRSVQNANLRNDSSTN